MGILRRRTITLSLPPGVLGSRGQAEPALTRMLSRARRKETPLLLIRLDVQPAPPAAPERFSAFITEIAARIRISDLCWWDTECGSLLLLFEEVRAGETMLARIQQCAESHGLNARVRRAQFPEEGLTLSALLEAVA